MDSRGVRLEEVDLVDRVAVDGTSKENQEYEETGTCDEDEGCEREEWPWRTLELRLLDAMNVKLAWCHDAGKQ